MRGFIKVTLIGHLGRAPELRHTNNGKAVANFSVAANTGYGDTESTEWVPVVVWEKTAENCAEYLDKGSPVYVEGRWQTREYTDRDGNDRKVIEVVAFQVMFLGKKGDRHDDGAPRDSGRQDSAADDGDDSEIPF